MKFKTFRLLVLGAVVLAAGGAAIVVSRCEKGPPPKAARPAKSAEAPAEPAPEVPSAEADDAAAPSASSLIAAAKLRPMDRAILQLLARPTNARLKDVFPDRPYKVNLYREAGGSTIDRVKIDLDRDGRWDEKWSIEGDDVQRQVAPDDDERYTRSTRLHADAWVTEKSP